MNSDTVLKMNLLGGMNEYIIGLGDEIAWLNWINLVPDNCTEDDLEFIANDNELWTDVCKLFGKLIERYDR